MKNKANFRKTNNSSKNKKQNIHSRGKFVISTLNVITQLTQQTKLKYTK